MSRLEDRIAGGRLSDFCRGREVSGVNRDDLPD